MKKGLHLHLLYLSERLSFFKSLKKQTLYLRQVKILRFNEKEEKWTENLNVPMTHFWCQDKNYCGLLEPQKVARNKMGPKRRGWICLQKEKPDKTPVHLMLFPPLSNLSTQNYQSATWNKFRLILKRQYNSFKLKNFTDNSNLFNSV